MASPPSGGFATAIVHALAFPAQLLQPFEQSSKEPLGVGDGGIASVELIHSLRGFKSPRSSGSGTREVQPTGVTQVLESHQHGSSSYNCPGLEHGSQN
jgi:hypothetical protein